MADCEFLPKCIFFNDIMKGMPKKSEQLKMHYCRAHFAQCARYRIAVSLGKEKVPSTLFPIQSEEADRILEQEEWLKTRDADANKKDSGDKKE